MDQSAQCNWNIIKGNRVCKLAQKRNQSQPNIRNIEDDFRCGGPILRVGNGAQIEYAHPAYRGPCAVHSAVYLFLGSGSGNSRSSGSRRGIFRA